MSAPNRPGAVLRAARAASRRTASVMTRLESRPGAHRPVGVPVLRRPRRATRRPAGRGGARRAAAKSAHSSSCWDRILQRSIRNAMTQPRRSMTARDPSLLAPGLRARPRAATSPASRSTSSRASSASTAATIVKLASNENPRGPSPAVRAAIAAAADELYALSGRQRLRAQGGARARASASTPTQIVLGNGSNDILELVDAGVPAARRRGRLLAARVRRLSAGHAGARRAPASRCRRATSATTCRRCARRSRRARASCSSPIRTIRPAPGSRRPRCEAFIASMPRDVLVVLDEAYNEYLEPAQQRADSAALDRASIRNLVVSRTFSKAYGLAALRVGYGIMDAERRGHAESRAPAVQRQRAGAGGGARGARRHRLRRREPRAQPRGPARSSTRASTRSASRSCRRTATSCWCKVGDAGARQPARCCAQGVIVRPVANYGLPEWLRITVGLPERERALPRRARGARSRADAPSSAVTACRLRIGKLVVVGVGLIGGSFALALKRAGARRRRSSASAARRANLDAALRAAASSTARCTLDDDWTRELRRRRRRAARRAGRRSSRRCSPRSRRTLGAATRSSPTPAAPSRT